MDSSEEKSFERYLSAKRSVDVRAFNQGVWEQLIARLKQKEKAEISVLEVGGGIGAMAERLLDQLADINASYLIVEQDAQLIKAAKASLEKWAAEHGYTCKEISPATIQINSSNSEWRISFIAEEIFQWFSDNGDIAKFDLLIGHALLDLLDIKRFLGAARPFLSEGALLYFPITYDGLTTFEPAIDPVFEEKMLARYHQSMDDRQINEKCLGGSRSGRLLFQEFMDAKVEMIAAGSSDWLVYPSQGKYPLDEAYFLMHILETIERELSGHPSLDQGDFTGWIKKRKEQVLDGELIYMAHQIDALGERR